MIIFQVAVLAAAAGLLAANIYGFTQLEQKFDPIWFVPRGSYASEFYDKQSEQFPSNGFRGSVYFGGINYTESLLRMNETMKSLQENKKAQMGEGSVQQWPAEFVTFVQGEVTAPSGTYHPHHSIKNNLKKEK